MNGRARLAPQEAPKKDDPLRRRIDSLLPSDYDSFDQMLEQVLTRRTEPGQPRSGQAFPSMPDPTAWAAPLPRIPTPPPVVEETSPYRSETAPVFQPGSLGQVRRQMGDPRTDSIMEEMRNEPQPWQPDQLGTPAPREEKGRRGLPPWVDVETVQHQQSPFDTQPMAPDATRVRGISDPDPIMSLPPAEQIKLREEMRLWEEQRQEEFVGAPTRGEFYGAQMGKWDRAGGMILGAGGMVAQGALAIAELGARQLPTEGVSMGLSMVHGGMQDKLEGWGEKVESFQERWMPPGGTSFYDVMSDPTKFADWAVPAVAQGGATSLIIMGAMAGGAPAGFAAAFALNYSELVDELEEAGLSRKQALEFGAIATGPVAFWDTRLPALIQRKIAQGVLTKSQGRRALEAARRDMKKHVLRRTVEAAGHGGLIEGVTEGLLQEGTTMLAGSLARMHTGEAQRELQDIVSRIIEAGAAGTMVGGVFGGAASVNLDVPRRSMGGNPLEQPTSPREFMAVEHEIRAATGEYGDDVSDPLNELREGRIEREQKRASKGIKIEPIEGFEVEDQKPAARERVRGVHPVTAAADVASAEREDSEGGLATYIRGEGSPPGWAETPQGIKDIAIWASGHAAKTRLEGSKLAAWAGRVAQSAYDGKSLDYVKATWGQEGVVEEAATETAAPASTANGSVRFRNEETGEHAVVTPNTKPDEKPWRVTYFGEDEHLLPGHKDFDAREEAIEWARDSQFADVVDESVPASTGDETQGVHPDEYTEANVLPLDPATDARVDVDDLQTMEGAQYKKYGKQAAAKGLESAKEWNDDLAGILLVWKGPPGEQYGKPVVINGHNRWAAARRLREEGKSVPPLRVRFIEAETIGDARAVGALTNIAEGRGTVWDAAEFFREGQFSLEDLQEKGLALGEQTVNRGFALSKLIPEIYRLAFAGQAGMTEEKGVIIGQAGLSETEQRGLLKHFRKKTVPSKEKLTNLIALAQGEAEVVEQGGLFGEEHFTESLLEEKADIKTAVDKLIRADAALSRKLLSAAAAAREKGAGEINELRAAEIGQEASDLETAFYVAQREDPVIRDYLDSAARIVKGHKTKKEKNNAIREQAAKLVQLLAESEVTAVGREAGGEADAGRATAEGEGRLPESGGATVKEAQAAYEEVTSRQLGQGAIDVGENLSVIPNPLYENDALVDIGFAWAVLDKASGEIVDEGSFAEMMERAKKIQFGEDVVTAGDMVERALALDAGTEVLESFESRAEVEDRIAQVTAQLKDVDKKLDSRKGTLRPELIKDQTALEQKKAALGAHLSVLHEHANEFLEANVAANESPMVHTTVKVTEDGRTIYGSAESPNFRRKRVELVRKERAEAALEKENKLRAAVRKARKVWSAPTPLMNRSVTLDQWMNMLHDALPKNKKGDKVRRIKSISSIDNINEVSTEIEALFTHLAQNPLLIHSASAKQIKRLDDLTSHPWFSEEEAPGSGDRPLGQKKRMLVKGDRSIRMEKIKGGTELTRDPDAKEWYFTHKKLGRVVMQKGSYAADPATDPLTQSIFAVKATVTQRGSDLHAVDTGARTMEDIEIDPEAHVDLGGKTQKEMFDDENTEEELQLEEPQFELNLRTSQRDQAVSNAYRTIANYHALWKQGDATERQMRQLQDAMKILRVWVPEETWGFTEQDLNALDAHFGNLRGEVRERAKYMSGGEQLDHFGLDAGRAGGAVDYMPSMDMPGAGQLNTDPVLSKEAADALKKNGLSGVFKDGIPSRREAIRTIGRALMTPITTGRTALGSSFGRFYVSVRSIRTKWAYDMETVGHEVGHSLMHVVWGPEAYTSGGNLSGRVLKVWSDELAPFGADYEAWLADPSGTPTPPVEWFAEYVRRYLTNRDQVVRVGGREVAIKDLELTKFMEEELKRNEPGVLEALDFASYVYKMWLNQTPEARILSQFQFQKEVKDDRAWAWLMVPPLARVKRAWIDMHVPFDTIVRTLNPQANVVWDPTIPLEENPAIWVRLMGGAVASGDEAWMYGITDPDTGERTSKGAEPVITRAINNPAFKNQQEGFYQLTVFGAALRNIERAQVAIQRAQHEADRLNEAHGVPNRFLVRESQREAGAFEVLDTTTDKVIGRGFKQYILGFSYEDSLAAIRNAEEGGYKEAFDEAMQDLYDYSNARLDYLVKMGVLTEEEAQRVKDGSKYYVPMVPVIDRLSQRKDEYQVAGPRHQLAKPATAPRHMKAPGSSAPKRNWIEQLYLDNQYLHLLAVRHKTLQSLYQMTKTKRGTAIFMEPIVTPTKGIPVRVKQLINQLHQHVDAEIVDYLKDNLGSEGMASMLMVYTPGDYMDAIDTVRVRDPDTGKMVWLQVNDPELLGALLGVESKSSPAFKKVSMTWAATTLRYGATISPGFSLFRNPGRDSIQAWIMSEWGLKLGHDHVRAVYHMLKKDELYQKFLQSGAAFSSLLDFDQKGIAKKIQRAQRSKVANVVGTSLEAMKILGTWTENMNRFAEYERAYEALLANGTPEMEARTRAAYAARDITVDFWRHGYQTAAIRQMVAFWNANLQGWNKMIRSAKENPGRFAWRTFQGITLPSILLWLVNHDDDDYNSLPRWLRDFYWLIPIDPGALLGGAAGALTGNPALIAAGAAAGHTVYDELFGDELDREPEDGVRATDVAGPVTGRNGKMWLKFPKPFIMGQFFGSGIERALDYAVGEDGNILEHLHNMAMSELTSLSPVPTGWRAILEVLTPGGYSWFRQAPLMGTEAAGRDRFTQYTPSTSWAARIIGNASSEIGFPSDQGLSPVKIDHLIYSYLGTAARDVVRLGDFGIKVAGQLSAATGITDEAFGSGVSPGRSLPELLPLIGDLTQKWPYQSSSNVDKLYDIWDEVSRRYDTQNFLQDLSTMTGSSDMRDYLDRHPGLFGQYYGVAAAYGTLSLLNTQQLAIQRDPGLSDKQKRIALAELWQARNDLAADAVQSYERATE